MFDEDPIPLGVRSGPIKTISAVDNRNHQGRSKKNIGHGEVDIERMAEVERHAERGVRGPSPMHLYDANGHLGPHEGFGGLLPIGTG